jgi:ribose/xylose/arabinose/galactoside ABC-type transport system permease subunit
MSWTIVILLGVALGVWALLRLTRFGRQLYATGGNPVAAMLAGIKVNRITTLAFVASGFFASLAGIILAADQGTAVPGIADGYLLPAYAAAFLSTVILSNGRFHMWGTITGGLAVVYISQGLVTGGVSYTWTDLINGLVLIVAVAMSTTLRRRLLR